MARFSISAASVLPFISFPSLAGPPLATEDPGILDEGQWEIITATTATAADGDNVYQAPVLDISLGVIEDYVQFAVAYPYVFSDPEDSDSNSDFGNPEVGIKWRFWNSRDLQVAFAPVYAFGVTRSLAVLGIGDDTNSLTLPLSAEYKFNNRLRLNPSLGYVSVEDGEDEWTYSAALLYSLNSRWELLGELVGATNTHFDEDILDVRIGFDFAIREDFHLLFSAATGLSEPSGEDGLDYDFYLGLQWFR